MDHVLIGSLITFTLALILSGLSKARLGLYTIQLLLIIAGLFSYALYLGINSITENGLNEAFFYHLEEDLEGANLNSYDNLLTHALLSYAGAVVLAVFFLSWLRRKKNHTSLLLALLSIALLCASLIINPTTQGFYQHYFSQGDNSLSTAYSPPQKAQGLTKNLLYIHLESLEAAYLNEAEFPELTPHLKRLSQQGLFFDNLHQTFGAEWTIAGMVTAQCGMPLTKPGKLITAHGFSKFLPKATCLGDTLKEAGYFLQYTAGANTNFAGKGTFYESHGFNLVEGLKELEPEVRDKAALTTWGLRDDQTFEAVLKRFNALENKQPFALMTLTLDTHSPFEVSQSCPAYPHRKEPMLQAVHCTDFLLGKLIAQLQQSPHYANTVVVIASDHLGVNVSQIVGKDLTTRKNLLIALNTQHAPQHLTRAGSLLDIAATLLPLMGAESAPYGLGRDLLSASPALQEETPHFSTVLSGNRKFFHQFWSFPSAKNGVHIIENGHAALLGSDRTEAPFLMTFDKALNVKSQFHLLDGRGAMTRYLSDIAFGEALLWLDSCEEIARKYDNTPLSKRCLAYGRVGGKVIVIPADNTFELSPAQLQQNYETWVNWLHVSQEKQSNINLRDLGTRAPYLLEHTAISPQFALLSSVSPSLISTARHDELGHLIEIEKGLRVIGLYEEQLPRSLFQMRCKPAPQNVDDTPTTPSPTLNSLVQEHSSRFKAIAVIYRPDPACSAADYHAFFKDNALSKWSVINDNLPYIGVFDQKGLSYEFVGRKASDQTVSVRFK